GGERLQLFVSSVANVSLELGHATGIVGGRSARQPVQAGLGGAVGGIQRQRMTVGCRGAFSISLPLQNRTEIALGAGRVRLQRDRAPETGRGLVEIAFGECRTAGGEIERRVLAAIRGGD